MSKQTLVLHVNFQRDVECLGKDLGQILRCIETATTQCHWYVFDVSGPYVTDHFPPLQGKPFCYISSTNELIRHVELVGQFHSGVFIAVNNATFPAWDLSFLPDTEEEPGLQHPDAELEIRAFDTSYFEICSLDPNLETLLRSCLPDAQVGPYSC